MTKIDTFQLRKAIPAEEFDYMLLSDALSQYSGVRQKIHQLLKSGVITRVKKGLYVFGPEYNLTPICKEVLANLIYGPSCLSLEYVLAFHGLIPERVEALTSITPKKDKEFDTPIGHFSYRYLTLEKYTAGIEQIWVDSTHPVLMATIEKALCDYIVLKKIPSFEDNQQATDFLENDLRIDPEHWTKFSLDKLQSLNRIYSNKNIDRILMILEQSRSKR
jgi:predicted transcriptional regulator of viral defense system